MAWSGRGKIQKVDVSIDGGVNWAEARLSGPADTKSMHRFYFEFNWDGKPFFYKAVQWMILVMFNPLKINYDQLGERTPFIIITEYKHGQ